MGFFKEHTQLALGFADPLAQAVSALSHEERDALAVGPDLRAAVSESSRDELHARPRNKCAFVSVYTQCDVDFEARQRERERERERER